MMCSWFLVNSRSHRCVGTQFTTRQRHGAGRSASHTRFPRGAREPDQFIPEYSLTCNVESLVHLISFPRAAWECSSRRASVTGQDAARAVLGSDAARGN